MRTNSSPHFQVCACFNFMHPPYAGKRRGAIDKLRRRATSNVWRSRKGAHIRLISSFVSEFALIRVKVPRASQRRSTPPSQSFPSLHHFPSSWISSLVRWRNDPLGREPSCSEPIFIRTRRRVSTPNAASSRRMCRFLPWVRTISNQLFRKP